MYIGRASDTLLHAYAASPKLTIRALSHRAVALCLPHDNSPHRINTMSLTPDQTAIITRHADRLLHTRAPPKTICPSEIARALSADELCALGAAEWRSTMDAVRSVVWNKRAAGEVEVLQKGLVVGVEDLDEIRGPMRVRLVVVGEEA